MTAATPQEAFAASFWEDDRAWQAAWPAAIAFAVLFHGVAFVAATQQPARKRAPPLVMAIAMRPPPPVVEELPPKPPEKPKMLQSAPPPAPAAPPTADPPPSATPPPLATLEPIALTPTTGEGVAVAAGTPDGEANAPPVSGEGGPLTTNRAVSGPERPDWDPNGYRNNAWDLMNRAKRYPRKAQVLGLEGKCVVKVMLRHDGSLAQRPQIIGKGTGHPALDEECITMAERVKFPPIPPHIEAPVMFRFPIEFHLENL